MTYTYLENINAELPSITADSIISRTLLNAPHLKVVLFGFAPGQSLSEHTSARPAILHVLEGQARLTLGDDHLTAGPGAWAHMPPHLPHSIHAETPLTMLLLLLKE